MRVTIVAPQPPASAGASPNPDPAAVNDADGLKPEAVRFREIFLDYGFNVLG
jgi:hypothetical protein